MNTPVELSRASPHRVDIQQIFTPPPPRTTSSPYCNIPAIVLACRVILTCQIHKTIIIHLCNKNTFVWILIEYKSIEHTHSVATACHLHCPPKRFFFYRWNRIPHTIVFFFFSSKFWTKVKIIRSHPGNRSIMSALSENVDQIQICSIQAFQELRGICHHFTVSFKGLYCICVHDTWQVETERVNVDRFLCGGDIDTHRLARDQKRLYAMRKTRLQCHVDVVFLFYRGLQIDAVLMLLTTETSP